MTFKLNKYTLFTALLTTMAAICMAQAICLLIPSAQTASADEEEGGATSVHTDSCDHDSASWQTLPTGGSLTGDESGGTYYYLEGNLNLAKDNITISSGTVTLCLNGKTLKGVNGASVITVSSGATFILCDCAGGGQIITSGSGYVADGGGLYVSGTFIMNGGAITGNTARTRGGGVYVGSDGVFIMNDGDITNNASSSGGGVYVDGGTFTMSGGTIKGNTGGCGVYVYGGEFTMKNGTISENMAGSGGGVYVESGKFTMENGTISSNTASDSYGGGGGVCVKSSEFTMKNGAISNNTASNGYGGGVWVNDGEFTMENGTISYNTAKYFNGVCLSSGKFTMSGGEITGNGVSVSTFGITIPDISGITNDGGGVYVGSGEFTMENGTISGNTATSGGGVYVNDGKFTMENGTISGNTATSGGGVYVAGGTFTMNNGKISDNTASSGGGVYVNGGTFTMSGGYIQDEVSKGSSGTVSVKGGYFGEDAYEDIKSDIDSNCTGVNLTDFATAYGSGRSKRSDTGDTYAVFAEGDYTINTVNSTYGDTYSPNVSCTDYSGNYDVYVLYTWGSYSNSLTLPTDANSYAVQAIIISVPQSGSGSIYAGATTFSITINPKSLTDSMFCLKDSDYTYNGEEQKADYDCGTLKVDVDFTVSYSSATNAGTVTITFTGEGNYTGTAKLEYVIKQKKLDSSMFNVTTDGYTYTGTAQNATYTCTDGSLIEGGDYTVSYSNNVNAGTATITFTGKGNYTGTVSVTYEIAKATISVETPTGITAKVGDSLNDIKLPEGWSWNDLATLDEVGEFGFEATYSAGDNYEPVTTTITVTVTGSGSDSTVSGSGVSAELIGFIIASIVFVLLVIVIIMIIRKRKEEVEG